MTISIAPNAANVHRHKTAPLAMNTATATTTPAMEGHVGAIPPAPFPAIPPSIASQIQSAITSPVTNITAASTAITTIDKSRDMALAH